MSNPNQTQDNETDRGSEQEQIFGRRIRRGDARSGKVPDAVAKTNPVMGTIYLPENYLVPGGPGASKKFSGPLEFSADGVPLGLWFYPANPAQHANVDRYWFDARMGVIQVKRVA
jgi:hypothetical protein